MRGILSRVRDLGRLVLSGNLSKAWWAVAYRAHSDSTSIGLRRDLATPFTAPSAKIPLTVQPLSGPQAGGSAAGGRLHSRGFSGEGDHGRGHGQGGRTSIAVRGALGDNL